MRLSLIVDGNATGAKKAAQDARDAVVGIGKAAEGASRQTHSMTAAMSQNVMASSAMIRGMAAASGQAAALGNSARLNGQQLMNMQMQLQDIGVMLASGQSPFVLLMQQGSQIAQMFGPGVGVGAALRSIGAGLVTFLTNPLNLALLGFSALAAGAGFAWSAIAGGAEESGAALERHEELIGRIRDAWPEAAEGARDYARESVAVVKLQLQADMQRLKETLRTELDGVFSELGKTSYAAPRVAQGAFFDVGEFAPFRAAILELRQELRDGEPDVSGFRRAVAAIAATDPENAALKELAGRVLELTEEAFKNEAALDADEAAIRRLGGAAAGQTQAVADFADALRALSGIALPDLDDRARALGEYQKAAGSSGGLEERRMAMAAYESALTRISAEEARVAAERRAREGDSSRQQAAGAAERERRAVEDVIAALSEETLTMQVSGRERQVQNALRQAGAAATAGERAEIRRIVEANYDLQESQRQTISTMDELRDVGRGVLSGIANDFRNSASAATIFLNAVSKIGNAFLDAGIGAASSFLFGKQGATGGGGLGSFFNRILGFARGAVFDRPTLFAYGAGQIGVMGEAGPEAVMPLQAARGGFAVGARQGGRETALPLTRLASGKLGVRAFAAGGTFGAGGFGPPLVAGIGSPAGGDVVSIRLGDSNVTIAGNADSATIAQFRAELRASEARIRTELPDLIVKAKRHRLLQGRL